VGSRDQPLVGQAGEVPAYRRRRHSEQLREVIDADGAVVVDDFGD
jgi:hypothetical protein